MNEQSRSLSLYGLVLLSLLILAGLGWVNYQVASQQKGGGSFLIYWMGTRALLVEGESPYSEAVAAKIQQALQARELDSPPFSRVTFPLYSIFFFLPFSFIADPVLAQTLWMVALEIFLFLLALACVRLAKWRMNVWSAVLFTAFVLTWFHSLIVLHEGSVVVLVALLFVWALGAIRNGQDELGGLLLALSTIRPLLVVLPATFILLWAITHRRLKLVAWFIGSLVLLILLGMFFLQGWVLQCIQAAFASLKPAFPMTPGAAFAFWWPGVGARLGWILTAVLGFALLVEWWMAFRVKEFRWFLWTVCLTLSVEQLIGIRTVPTNYILLLLPLTLVFAVWEERWRRTGRWTRALVATLTGILVLELGSWAIFYYLTGRGMSFNDMLVLLFPLPVFLLVTLYWVRWWAVRPQSLYVEDLREGEVA